MNVQRVGVRALQQAARPNAFAQNLPRLMLASMQTRPASSTKLTETEAQSLLASQRLQRPVAPHLQIYDFQQTWFSASVWTRITGGLFTSGLYIFSISYLAAPLLGWHLESQSLAAAAASLPFAVSAALKFGLAWPFTFHLFNGTRHLVWDFAKGFSRPVIKQTNWAIWGASLLTALGLVAAF
ncbi:succinate dehydrogenase cytochrome b subunit [Xylariaceae sp. FL0255]|nr:succinate dehydrogenase cytochrome b subunit [Xylariaceae sp. FL0255]